MLQCFSMAILTSNLLFRDGVKDSQPLIRSLKMENYTVEVEPMMDTLLTEQCLPSRQFNSRASKYQVFIFFIQRMCNDNRRGLIEWKWPHGSLFTKIKIKNRKS